MIVKIFFFFIFSLFADVSDLICPDVVPVVVQGGGRVVVRVRGVSLGEWWIQRGKKGGGASV